MIGISNEIYGNQSPGMANVMSVMYAPSDPLNQLLTCAHNIKPTQSDNANYTW